MRKKFVIARTNVGKGGFFHVGGKRYHGPSWTEVEEDTTLDDIEFEAEPFAELFEEKKEEQWKFTSARSGDEYIVRYNIRKELSCSCWGYIAHRKCKHIKEVMELVA
jgi:transketolase